MGRGKIETDKKIDNPTMRQVTFSKRRKGLFKKADELTILCDAKVSIIIISSSSKKLSEYISDSTTTKEIFDRYQKTLGIDLWSNKYEKMQEELRKLKEKNNRLRREMRHRKGEDLSGFDFSELHRLEQEMEASFAVTHFQHDKKLSNKINTLTKKTKDYDRYFPCPRNNHVGDVEPKLEDVYGIVDNGGGAYDSAAATATSHLYAIRLHSHIHHPNLHYLPVLEPHQFRLV